MIYTLPTQQGHRRNDRDIMSKIPRDLRLYFSVDFMVSKEYIFILKIDLAPINVTVWVETSAISDYCGKIIYTVVFLIRYAVQ